MAHALRRTNEKGVPFIGYCVKCGKQGLPMSASFSPCPADAVMSDTDATAFILKDLERDNAGNEIQ